MGICKEYFIYYIVVDGVHSLDTLAASVLYLEGILWHSLDISELCHGDNYLFSLDKLFICYIIRVSCDRCSSLITVLVSYRCKLSLDDSEKLVLICKYLLVLSYLCNKFIVLVLDLLSLQTCQSTESHVNDCSGLCLGKSKSFDQLCLGLSNILGISDDRDYFIYIIQCYEITL